MAKNANDHIEVAQAAYEAGFLSMAAKKRALDELSRAYGNVRENLMRAILAARTEANDAQNNDDYWNIPYELHHVRDRHFDIAARYSSEFSIVRDLIALRSSIKAAEIAPAPAKPEIEVKAEKVRRSIIEEMERRKALFVEGLDVTRLFNEIAPRADGKPLIPVSVNAHMVHGHKGTIFVRHFFYLSGKLTPLNTIIAIAEAYADEHEAAR